MANNQEGKILLAMQAIRLGQIKCMRVAAKTFEVPYITLRRRMKGISSRSDSTPNSRKLSSLEESALIQYILELDLRGFSPRPSEIGDMANLLLAKRQALLVVNNFS
jgi:helix-turn-helix, Psq domain